MKGHLPNRFGMIAKRLIWLHRQIGVDPADTRVVRAHEDVIACSKQGERKQLLERVEKKT